MHKYALVALLLLVSTCFAQLPQVVVYDAPGGAVGGVATLARAWKGVASHSSYCNKNWTVTFTNQASIAQWMDLYIESLALYWRVLKPGEYACDGIGMHVRSNGDVKWTFAGWADMTNSEGDVIQTWYAITNLGDPAPGPGQWIPAADLNTLPLLLPENQAHANLSLQLWNRIKVIECDSACEYADQGGATITITAEEQKPWVDTVTGDFLAGYATPPGYPG